MDYGSIIQYIRSLLEEAQHCNQRRMLVLQGDRLSSIALLRKIIEKIDFPRGIVFTWKIDFDMPLEIEELKNSERYLGTTYDFLAVDVHHSFIPNDLGKLINIVRGGGLIVLLTPKFEEWPTHTNFFHEIILTPPYTLENIKNNFIRWIIRKIGGHEGIGVIRDGIIVKDGHMRCTREKREVRIPSDSRFPRKIYSMAITQDQVRVLKMGEKMAKRGIMVLTADRGRGKSSVLGILVAQYAGKFKRIGVTAPDINNLSEFFKFLKKTLEIRGLRYQETKRGIHGKKFKVEYVEPAILEPKKYELLVVDEAAGIPVPLLLNYLRAGRVIYSTTIHGYEGTGRSFSIRFMEELKKRTLKILNVEMTEPIRYSQDDPIERWIFDALLLDSEPYPLKDVKLQKLEYRRYEIEELLSEEDKLREYYGIFVLAHYRNNPNDLGILCDAPNHEIRTLEYQGHVVCSVQLAKEGNLGTYVEEMYYGTTPPGNIVPDVLIKHYREREFGKYRGYRIVRIATHPDFMNSGIGSRMLSHIKEENVDWIGSSFGATERLLRFWIKNGFYPIHISPKLNERTGEYSVVVMYPKHREIVRNFKSIRKRFGKKFVQSLSEVHRNVDLDIARLLLQNMPRDEELQLDDVDWRRLVAYAWGPGNYEVTLDVIYHIASKYFFLKKRPKLNEEQEKILIGKVLQHRNWEDVGRELGHGGTYVVIELREIMRKFLKEGYEDEIFEFQRRFHGEN